MDDTGAAAYLYWLYINDGIKNRQNRKNIINPDFTKVGIAYCPHSKYNGVLVMTYGREGKSKASTRTTKRPEIKRECVTPGSVK